ncbi:9830_t:CDS:2 [Rhizophagus irregularis]|nr:9830_t:CDS:2 [Rhizophagus irregularis]
MNPITIITKPPTTEVTEGPTEKTDTSKACDDDQSENDRESVLEVGSNSQNGFYG